MIVWGWGGKGGKVCKGAQKTLVSVEYVHYFDCRDGFKSIYICLCTVINYELSTNKTKTRKTKKGW